MPHQPAPYKVMIPYSRETQQQIPAHTVKIIGLGGAGANMLERIALESIDGAELLALNTDIRTLSSSLAKDKIQLGTNLTKGLGTGGDPDLGQQAVLESEEQIRQALKGQRIVFLCTGLGGGTGSGAAPIVSRIAREEGAFVVVFATMPFFFEGRRRQEQAETALNQLAVLSNALVTFDNNRMGELVLAKQGIHEAFVAADRMISESIKAVIRLVVRPGIIKIGLDDLMSALRTNRSRCLFGSGIADGKDRAAKALRNALSSPLLDQGSLLKDAQTVLVHLSGGESLTLFEIELLMQNLQKFVPENAHVLFGAAIDPAMNDKLSITLISALPEDALKTPAERPANISKPATSTPIAQVIESPFKVSEKTATNTQEPPLAEPIDLFFDPTPEPEISTPVIENEDILDPETTPEPTPEPSLIPAEPEERPFAEPQLQKIDTPPTPESSEEPETEESPDPSEEIEEPESILDPPPTKSRFGVKKLWGKSKPESSITEEIFTAPSEINPTTPASSKPELKLSTKSPAEQNELAFDSAPKGRFQGESPNVIDGEDLDLPPFLRKKRP